MARHYDARGRETSSLAARGSARLGSTRFARMLPKLLVTLLCLCLASLPHCSARAQEASARLAALRVDQLEARRVEGYWLLGWGAANTLVGSGLAIGMRDSPPARAASLTSASFGLINALLSLGLLDLSHKQRRVILAEARGHDASFSTLRERALIAQLKSGQGFALNAGLDVFYIASGALLFGLGQAYGKRWGPQEGAGLAMVGQGAFLLGFDLFCWFAANRRAEAVRVLR
jgi:hypothetical protein